MGQYCKLELCVEMRKNSRCKLIQECENFEESSFHSLAATQWKIQINCKFYKLCKAE